MECEQTAAASDVACDEAHPNLDVAANDKHAHEHAAPVATCDLPHATEKNAPVMHMGGVEVSCAQAAAQLSGLTLVYVARVNGVLCKVLLDTGSEVSFVSQQWLERYASTRSQSRITAPLQIVTANNVHVNLSVKANLSLWIGTHQSQVDFMALPDMLQAVNIILGMDWMKQHVSMIDIRTGVCVVSSSTGMTKLRPARRVPDAIECCVVLRSSSPQHKQAST